MVTKTEFQIFLDAIFDCFIAHDFAPWRDRIMLPFSLIPRVGPVILETSEELCANFDLYLQACKIMDFDQIVRAQIDLLECPDGTWIGTYEINLLGRGQRATTPYTASALLIPTEAGLRMGSVLNARGHHDETNQHPGFKPT